MVNFAKTAIFIIEIFFVASIADPKLTLDDQKTG